MATVRRHIRSGAYQGHTSGLAPGRLQCNLAILTEDFADDFRDYCLSNPRPCPLVGLSKPGVPAVPYLGEDIDLRTDVPRYNVYRHGELAEQRADITDIWRDDFVVFALGCSFTFEHALLRAGIPLRHIEQNRTVPMFQTSVETVSAGPFAGGMVVSMRPVNRADIPQVIELCARYGHAHGAPIHHGDPDAIGIADVSQPEWGDPTEIRDDEEPVFWACGVTPQSALAQAKPPICITHTPGCMLITDVSEEAPPPESPFAQQ